VIFAKLKNQLQCNKEDNAMFFNVNLSNGLPGAVVGLLLLGCSVENAPAATIRLKGVGSGLQNPVAITHAKDGSGRLFITEQGGKIRILKGSQVLATPFLDISSRVSTGGEQGLLSVAFHPKYKTNGFFFVNYTDRAGDTIIARYKVSSSNPDRALGGSRKVILVVKQPYSSHNGGQLQFGPRDGYLYIGMGDGGGAGDPGNRAQSLKHLLGKMLRIDVNNFTGPSPYTIPANNPFVRTTGARKEIWALGLRNPWRFSFDRTTGDLFIGDVGAGKWEEVDLQSDTSRGGENYGWRHMEGRHCYNPSVGCKTAGLKRPILEYGHSQGQAITGGYRYRGSKIPGLRGKYLYADFGSGRIWGATLASGRWRSTQLRATNYGISTFGEDQSGEIYLADYFGGAVYKIIGYTP
jgi:glucose/arabinose dehydrogenase